MTNPFDDLESSDSASGSDSSESETDGADRSAESPADPPSIAEAESGTAPEPGESTPEQTADETPDISASGPAFEYSAVRQKPLYARDETWTEFEKKLRTSITPTLAKEDVVDEETREIHDAVLRLANLEPERVAELVLEARRQS